jgi:hypothetical protein
MQKSKPGEKAKPLNPKPFKKQSSRENQGEKIKKPLV